MSDKRIYLDSETCGLHSMMVLLQYAIDDGPITLYDVWKNPVGETLDKIEQICKHTVVGFNLVFDWFHIQKIHSIFSLCPKRWIPEDHIEEIALLEPLGQQGLCVKPANALDLLLHSRKGPYQSLMARSDIRIRRVPTPLAYALAAELEERVQIDGIYFARSADKDAPRWQVYDSKDRKTGEFDPNFKDVVLRFNPAGGLKFLAEHALGYKPKYHYEDVEIDKKYLPKELGYAPYALAVSTPSRRWEVYKTENCKRRIVGHAWPALIQHHIDHWANNEPAREYASDDILYTRDLCYHFAKIAGVDVLPAGDDDSILSCMVPVVRWRGFEIDGDGMRQLLRKARQVVKDSPVNINKPPAVRAYIAECMDDTEFDLIRDSTAKAKLQKIANNPKWEIKVPEDCTKCMDDEGVSRGHHAGGFCHRCQGTGTMSAVGKVTGDHVNHPASVRSWDILAVKVASKEVELYRKLIRAKKFHTSFNVVGTLSSRMSGGDGLNAQGIKASKEVRRMFPLAWHPKDITAEVAAILGNDPGLTEVLAHVNECHQLEQYLLCGGDFDSFEVTLTDAVYKDPDLRKSLTTRVDCHKCNATGKITPCQPDKPCKGCKDGGKCKGKATIECEDCEGTGKTTKKIHALFAMCLFPGTSYEEIVASAGTKNDMYSKGKQGVFAMIYGGDWNTLVKNLGIEAETAQAAFATWNKWFPQSAKARARTFKAFCSMRQMDNSQIVWEDPADFVESFLGFRRYFTLENKIAKVLHDLAKKPPKAWKECQIKVHRMAHKGIQTAYGAVASALFGASFQIQAGNQRAAANHEIQSPGGQITKAVQRKVWDLQPAGIHPLYVAPMNIHDEIMCVTHPGFVEAVGNVVKTQVESYRELVPLIGMTWNKEQANWADKKGGTVTLKVRSPLMMAPSEEEAAA